MSKLQKVSIMVIGDEILSGRTIDKNVNFIAKRCDKIGLNLFEVRIIPDEKIVIKDTILELSKKSDYVFTTGGIGPTHDDITTESIALAFGRKLEINSEAVKRMKAYYKNMKVEFNKARYKMATIPEGAELIDNPVSAAPGFILANVYVLPGVPSILQEMFMTLEHKISSGKKMLVKNIKVKSPEGEIAETLEIIQGRYEEVTIGSYPFFKPPDIGSMIVLRSLNKNKIQQAFIELLKEFQNAKILYEFD